MKKTFFLLLLVMSICGAAFAQTVTLTGTVKDVNGNLLHYAFVQNKHDKIGTYTDSLGNFTLVTAANAMLTINCAGYKDTEVSAGGKDALTVIMKPDGNSRSGTGESQGNTAIVQTTLNEQIDHGDAPIMQQGSIMPSIHVKDATQGSRTLFKDWVHGYIVNSGDTLIQNPGFLLNYDKIGGNLLLTKDKVSTVAIFKNSVHSFTLFDVFNQPYTFTFAPAIDKKHYVQVIADGNNYKIYKLTTTKFVESNYTSDGLASSGNN